MILPFLPVDPAEANQYDIVDSPIGRLLLKGGERALAGLYLLDAGSHSASVQPGWTRHPGGYSAASRQLAEYFAGERTEFDLPLAPCGTRFQLAVWAELARIPFGTTVSYGDVAAAIGKSPVASRAVGLANGRNPISIILPCHRVIGADGSLTGYGWGLERKEWLLRHEGAFDHADPALWLSRGDDPPEPPGCALTAHLPRGHCGALIRPPGGRFPGSAPDLVNVTVASFRQWGRWRIWPRRSGPLAQLAPHPTCTPAASDLRGTHTKEATRRPPSLSRYLRQSRFPGTPGCALTVQLFRGAAGLWV